MQYKGQQKPGSACLQGPRAVFRQEASDRGKGPGIPPTIVLAVSSQPGRLGNPAPLSLTCVLCLNEVPGRAWYLQRTLGLCSCCDKPQTIVSDSPGGEMARRSADKIEVSAGLAPPSSWSCWCIICLCRDHLCLLALGHHPLALEVSITSF